MQLRREVRDGHCAIAPAPHGSNWTLLNCISSLKLRAGQSRPIPQQPLGLRFSGQFMPTVITSLFKHQHFAQLDYCDGCLYGYYYCWCCCCCYTLHQLKIAWKEYEEPMAKVTKGEYRSWSNLVYQRYIYISYKNLKA